MEMVPIVNFGRDGLGDRVGTRTCFGMYFDIEIQLREALPIAQDELELHHLLVFAYDGLDLGWVQIVALDEDHIVDSRQDTAVKTIRVPPAGTFAADLLDEITSTITDQRAPDSAQIGDDQLSRLPVGYRVASAHADDFRDEFGLQDVGLATQMSAFDAHRSDFGHATMIEDSGAPSGFNTIPYSGNRGTWLSGEDQCFDCGAGEIEPGFCRGLSQAQGISWGAANAGDTVDRDHFKAGMGTETASGEYETTTGLSTFNSGPKSDKRPKRERKV